MKNRITRIRALEVLNSRGYPTVQATVMLDSGISASASVAADGEWSASKEAIELRDSENSRYCGHGTMRAVSNIEQSISPALRGFDPTQQAEIDRTMIEMDGTPKKSRLGGNAILAVSIAVARAGALACDLPLYAYLGGPNAVHLPVPMLNILNGGNHASNSIDLEEFMAVPTGATSFAEALRYGAETFQALREILRQRGHKTDLGDEGGLTPNLKDNEEPCSLIVEAIGAAGLRPGVDVAIAIDAGANHFFQNGKYNLERSGRGIRTAEQMVAFYGLLIQKYPVVAIEDGLADNDWLGFIAQNNYFGWKVQIVGDHLYATDPRLVAEGIAKRATNAIIVRPGQVGTVSEAVHAVHLCRRHGWGFIVAGRAADTEDTFIADFAVAMGGGQIKCGSTARGERVAKYNRLLEIESELGKNACFDSPIKWQPWQEAAQEKSMLRV